MVLLTICIVGLIGFSLIIIGLRGRQIDDHPVCVKCGYDLSHIGNLLRPCPECGIDMEPENRVRFGRRGRRRRPLIIGLVCCGLVLFWGGIIIAQSNTRLRFEINHFKPVVLLRHEAFSDDENTATWAWSELTQRVKKNRLSEKQVDDLIERLWKAWMSDPERHVPGSWWMFSSMMVDKGGISRDQFERVLNPPFDRTFEPRMRKQVRTGQWVRFALHNRYQQIERDLSMIAYIVRLDRVSMGDKNLEFQDPHGWQPGPLSGRRSQDVAGRFKVNAPPGQHEIEFEITVGVLDSTYALNNLSYSRNAVPDEAWEQTLVTWTVQLVERIHIIRDDESLVKMVHDDKIVEELRNRISLQPIKINIGNKLQPATQSIYSGRPPMPIPFAFEIFWRVDGREWKVGQFVSDDRRESDYEYILDFPAHIRIQMNGLVQRNSQIDLILRPSESLALETLDVSHILGDELIFIDVQVEDLSTNEP